MTVSMLASLQKNDCLCQLMIWLDRLFLTAVSALPAASITHFPFLQAVDAVMLGSLFAQNTHQASQHLCLKCFTSLLRLSATVRPIDFWGRLTVTGRPIDFCGRLTAAGRPIDSCGRLTAAGRRIDFCGNLTAICRHRFLWKTDSHRQAYRFLWKTDSCVQA